MYNYDLFSNSAIILFIFLLVVIFLIYQNYKQPFNKKSYLINIYLYTIGALLFVTLVANFISKLPILNDQNYFKFLILYLVLVCCSFSIMFQANPVYNHLGFILFLFGLSLLLSISFKFSNNIPQAVLFASGILLVITLFVFTLPEETLIRYSAMMPSLTWIFAVL